MLMTGCGFGGFPVFEKFAACCFHLVVVSFVIYHLDFYSCVYITSLVCIYIFTISCILGTFLDSVI